MWESYLASIESKVEAHKKAQSQRISLIASGNAVSRRIRHLMDSDFINRAAEGRHSSAVFPGLEAYYDFEMEAEEYLRSVFGADFADIRPISGTQANHIIFHAFTTVGDTVAAPTIQDGGHVSVSGRVTLEIRDLNLLALPTHSGNISIDVGAAALLIREIRPSLVFLGGSVVIEAQPLAELVHAAQSIDAVVCFDASHVAGLIATGYFPNPLSDGVDVLTMTTCKTIPGPSHAWIVGANKHRKKIERLIFPGYVSGGHLQESIGALGALAEILAWPINYGAQVVNTARALGEALQEGGVEVLRTTSGTVTDTHQVLAWTPKQMPGHEAVRVLADANILANANILPESLTSKGDALRFGTQELAWRGGTEAISKEVGHLIADLLHDRCSTAVIARRIKELATDALKEAGRPPNDYANG